MKKSFKKAGAAVLSMSMLLAMGAVTMPVYALPDYENIAPAQVAVTIAKNNGHGDKHADDAGHKYEYLDDVDNATVHMYRIATLGGNGWQWESTLENLLKDTSVGAVDSANVVYKFEELLKKGVWDDVNKKIIDAPSNATEDELIPRYDSAELQSLAAKIERLIKTNPSGLSLTEIGTGTTITKMGDGFSTAYLPADTALFSDTASDTTRDIIGYYILVTDTDDSGVVMQPVLLPLRNVDTSTNPNAYIKSVSLKGNNITVDKSIEDVVTKVDADGNVLKNDDTPSKVYASRDDISKSKDSAVVSGDDVITYRICADVPSYDKQLTGAQLNDTGNDNSAFVITDTPEKGINVIGRLAETSEGEKYADVTATGSTLNTKIKVYYSVDKTLVKDNTGMPAGTVQDIKLEEGQDYTVVVNNPQNGGKGFKILINGYQLRGLNSEGAANQYSALYHAASGDVAAYSDSMEGAHIFVEFEAVTDEGFNRSYTDAQDLTPDATVDDLLGTTPTITVSAANMTAAKALNPEDFKTAMEQIPEAKRAAVIAMVTEIGTDNEKLAAAGLALIAKQAEIDAENATKKTANDVNGTDNTGSITYNNKFSHKGTVKTVDDKTTLYSVDLDLTKMARENKIDTNGTTVTHYVSGALGTTTDATDTNILNDGATTPKNIMKKKGSTYLTTTVATEAEGYVNGAANEPIVYVTSIPTSTNASDAVTEGTSTVYVTNGSNHNMTTTTAGDAWTEGVTRKKYVTGELVTTTDANDTNILKDGSDHKIMLKAGSKYLTTITSGEADATPKYVLSIPSGYTRKAAVGDVFVSSANANMTTTDESAAATGTPTDPYYTDNNQLTPVQGAIFKLSPVHTANIADGNRVLSVASTDEDKYSHGYAVSTSTGHMKMLKVEEVTVAEGGTAPVAVKTTNTDDIVYVEDLGGNKYRTYTVTADDAWTRLSAGTYNLKEIYAPSGYKQLKGNATFTITAKGEEGKTPSTTDDIEFNGDFEATSSSSAFWNEAAGTTADKNTVTFHFDKTNGQLEDYVINEYDDSLPATGGIGTVLFTAGGIAVVLMAGALFVMYMKKKNSEDEE